VKESRIVLSALSNQVQKAFVSRFLISARIRNFELQCSPQGLILAVFSTAWQVIKDQLF
jgi:hypothetical protein